MEDNNNSYIIQKDDTNARDLVNSLKHKSTSPNHYKVWTPGISNEEVYKKKRNREDDYVQHFHPEDRPILLIKNKHAYTGIENSEVFDNPYEKEDYFKITDNTQEIDNINEEIQQQSGFIHRKTQYLPMSQSKEKEDNSIYKIDGIEFLPEGFIELDPLLYKDDYKFENKIHEQMFSEQQRQLKAKRRKQYTQRNHQKMRDVTIYVLEEHKDKVVEYLERWYFKNRRRMRPDEIKYVAELLQVEEETMKNLQDLFLRKQKILNTKQLRDYLLKNGRLVNNRLSVPPSLMKYFIKKNDPYGNVESRVYKPRSEYEPNMKHLRYKKIGFSQRIQPYYRASSQNNKSQRQSQLEQTLQKQMSNNQKDVEDEKIFQQNNQVYNRQLSKTLNDQNQQQTFNRQYSQTQPIQNFNRQVLVENGAFSPERYIKEVPKNIKSQKELQNYFDSEVNNILEDVNQPIKKSVLRNPTTTSYKKSVSFKDQPPRVTKHLNNIYDNVMQENLRDDLEQSQSMLRKQKISKSRKSTIKNKPRITQHLEELYNDILKDQKRSGKTVKQSIMSNKPKITLFLKEIYEDLIEDDDKPKISIKQQTLQREPRITQHLEGIYKQILFDQQKSTRSVRKSIINNNPRITQYLENIYQDINNNNKRLSQKSPSRKSTKLKVKKSIKNNPKVTKFLQGIYEDILEDQQQQNLTVRQSIANNQPRITQYLQGIYEDLIEDDTQPKIDLKETQLSQNPRVTQHLQGIYEQILNDQLQSNRSIKKSVIKNETRITQHLQGVYDDLLKDQTQVNTKETPKNKFQKTVTKISNANKFVKNLQEEEDTVNSSDQEMNQEQNFDDQQIKRITIVTKDEQNRPMQIQKLGPILIGNQYYYQEVETKLTQGGQKKTTLITRNDDGFIISKKSLNVQNMGNYYNNFAILEAPDKIGQRKTLLLLKDEKGQTLDVQKIQTTLPHFFNINEQRISKQSKIRQKNKTMLVLQPVDFIGQHYQQIINQYVDDSGKQRTTVITKNKDGQILAEEDIQDSTDDYYKTLVEEIMTDDSQQKMAILKTINKEGNEVAQHVLRATIFDVFDPDYFNYDKEKFFEREGAISRVYSINPVTVKDTFIYQDVIETKDQFNRKHITVVTKDQFNKEVGKDELIRDLKGSKFRTEIIEEQDENKERLLTVITKSDLDEVVSVQQIRPTLLTVLGEDYDLFEEFNQKSKGKKSYTKKKVDKKKIIKSHYLRPTQVCNDMYQQIIEETIADGYKQKTLIKLQDKNGKLIKKSVVNIDKLEGEQFHSEVVREDKSISIVIKNENEQIVAVQKIKEEEMLKMAKKYLEEIQDKIGQDDGLIETHQRGKTTITQKHLRPTQIADDYYFQTIEEIKDENNNKKSVLITRNQMGTIIGVQNIDDNYIQDQLNVQPASQNKRISIVIQNSQGQQVAHQVISEPQNKQVIFRNSTFGSKQIERAKNQTTISYPLHPTLLGNTYYQAVVQQIIDDKGDSRFVALAQNEQGDVVSSSDFDQKLQSDNYNCEIVDDYIDQTGQRNVTMSILNNNNQRCATLKIRPTAETKLAQHYFDDMNEDDITKNEVEVIRKNNSTLIIKKLRPAIMSSSYYSFYFIEKIVPNGGKKLTFVAKDENNKVINKEILNPRLASINYNACIEETLNEIGYRKVTVVFKNEKDEVVLKKQFNIEDDQIQEQKIENLENQFDKKGKLRNTVLTTYSQNQQLRSISLRPTLIGNQYYQQTINEVIENGKKKISIVTVNDKGDIVAIDQLANESVGEYYDNIVKEIYQDGQQLFVLETIDENLQIVSKQTLQPEQIYDQIVDELIQAEDKTGHKKVSVFKGNSFKVLTQAEEEDLEVYKKISEPFQWENQIKKTDNFSLKNIQKQSVDNRPFSQTMNVLMNPVQNKKPKVRFQDNVFDNENREHKKFRATGFIKNKVNFDVDDNEDEVTLKINNKNYNDELRLPNQTRPKSNTPYPHQNIYIDDSNEHYVESKIIDNDHSQQSGYDDQRLRKIVREVFEQEKSKLSQDLFGQLESRIKESQMENSVADEFYKFCHDKLPQKRQYQENMLLMSLFYYFLERRN